MDWSIQDVANMAGTTSRTLRHYDEIWLLKPTRIGSNGYRRYDEGALVRLQRILLLRELGLGLSTIAEVLEGARDNGEALRVHLHWLRREKKRLERQITAVEQTITKLERGEPLMAQEMFEGFDHTQHKDEVIARWGSDAYAKSDEWWNSQTDEERQAWKQHADDLCRAWIDASRRGITASSDEAQALAQRQFEWLRGVPGTPGGGAAGPTKEYFVGLAEMYVADERFAANYGGLEGATFVRDAMQVYAERNL